MIMIEIHRSNITSIMIQKKLKFLKNKGFMVIKDFKFPLNWSDKIFIKANI